MEEQLDIPSKKRIRQAGDILRNPDSTNEDFTIATGILSQWRQIHFYPMNTFQSYLRKNVKKPSGAKPGMVIYFTNRTLYMTPKEEEIQQLTIFTDVES